MTIPPASAPACRPLRPAERRLLGLAAAAFVLNGIGLLLGPMAWRSSRSYSELRHLPGGLGTVGAVYLGVGVGQLYVTVRGRNMRAVLTLGAVVAGATAGAYLLAAVFGELAAVGAPILWCFLMGAEALYARRCTGR